MPAPLAKLCILLVMIEIGGGQKIGSEIDVEEKNRCEHENALSRCVPCNEEENREVPMCMKEPFRLRRVCEASEKKYLPCEEESESTKKHHQHNHFKTGIASEFNPQSMHSVLRSSLFSFELVCLIMAITCGLLMRHRKSLLMAQQQHRYFKLIERS
eukprot:TRINITY_DN1991_c0_g1_i2.p1 TRINITY_DN1991_c0_g1~~TRINITY_DN1991_c0_g1_i2.p1  ORF type:complete len:157 (+),score=33.21 TRINITY_DN1991_c0_g1_i2:34-504(+)